MEKSEHVQNRSSRVSLPRMVQKTAQMYKIANGHIQGWYWLAEIGIDPDLS